MSFGSVIACDLCEDVPAIFSKKFKKNLCEDCFRELKTGQVPPMDKVTSGREELQPGARRMGYRPGKFEDNDQLEEIIEGLTE